MKKWASEKVGAGEALGTKLKELTDCILFYYYYFLIIFQSPAFSGLPEICWETSFIHGISHNGSGCCRLHPPGSPWHRITHPSFPCISDKVVLNHVKLLTFSPFVSHGLINFKFRFGLLFSQRLLPRDPYSVHLRKPCKVARLSLGY